MGCQAAKGRLMSADSHNPDSPAPSPGSGNPGSVVDHDRAMAVPHLGEALEVDVTAPEDLPEDAPKLRIHAVTRMGGGLITAMKD